MAPAYHLGHLLAFAGAFIALTSFRPCVNSVLEQARYMVGIREATGHNDGPEIRIILASVDLPEGNFWCAASSYYAFCSAGCEPFGKARRFAWVPTWFPESRVIWKKSIGTNHTDGILPGDTYSIYNNGLHREAHMGIVDHVDGRYIYGYEGNTNGVGSRDGQGFYLRTRHIDQIYQVSRWIR